MGIVIRPFSGLADVGHLLSVARSEGFNFLDRLVKEWNDGTNRFDRPGEILLIAQQDGQTVGMAGITVQRERVGRVRRVYVHPNRRRDGIASRLMGELLRVAPLHFGEMVLFTDTSSAARFYERLGFVPEDPAGPDHATHRLRLVS